MVNLINGNLTIKKGSKIDFWTYKRDFKKILNF